MSENGIRVSMMVCRTVLATGEFTERRAERDMTANEYAALLAQLDRGAQRKTCSKTQAAWAFERDADGIFETALVQLPTLTQNGEQGT